MILKMNVINYLSKINTYTPFFILMLFEFSTEIKTIKFNKFFVLNIYKKG